MNYKVNEIVLGTVSGIQPYGAFIKFDNNEQGLIHISEISSYFVKDIEKFVKLGQKIKMSKNDTASWNGMVLPVSARYLGNYHG